MPVEGAPARRTRCYRALVRDLSGLPEVRAGLTRFLRCSGVAEPSAGEVTLVAHELLANGLLHGRPPVDARVDVRAGSVRVRVRDRGSGPSAPRPSDHRSGRGLQLVEALCSSMQALDTDEGHEVVVDLVVPAA